MYAGSLSFDAFLERRSADQRLARLTHDIGLPKGDGLEFGAADKPTPLPEGLDVTYVDHAPGGRANLPEATAVDHAWSGSGCLATVIGRADYDFAIAAHTVHCVPNLLGWLRGVHAVLRPGGVLNLSLPDKRFMSDAPRTESTIAELIEADLLAFTRPSPRQIFAHTYEARGIAPARIWAGKDAAQAPRLSGEAALALAQIRATEAVDSDRHVPCHCWVFTPLSFLTTMEEATRLGLFPFVLNQMAGTEPGGSEFFVSMRRDAEEDPHELRALQEGAIGHLLGILERQRRVATLLAR